MKRDSLITLALVQVFSLAVGGVSVAADSTNEPAAPTAATGGASRKLVVDGYSVVSVAAPKELKGKKIAKVGVTVSIRNATTKTVTGIYPQRTRARLASASGTKWTWTCERFDDLMRNKKKSLAPGEALKNTYMGMLWGTVLPECGKKVEIETTFKSSVGLTKVTHTSDVMCAR